MKAKKAVWTGFCLIASLEIQASWSSKSEACRPIRRPRMRFVHRIDGYLRGYGEIDPSKVSYIALRDRDLDFDIPPRASLIEERSPKGTPPNQWIFTTYRACIESYLIDAGLIHDYWVYRFSGIVNRPADPPPSSDAISQTLIKAAKTISDYQATRWAIASVRPKERPFAPRLFTSWCKKDGILPDDLSFEKCLESAQEHVRKEWIEHPLANVNPGDIAERAEEYRERFLDPGFYKNGGYWVWFHGKDLIKVVFRLLNVPQLQSEYERWAIERLEFKQHDDLRELSEKCSMLH